jgi:hypothetical protein
MFRVNPETRAMMKNKRVAYSLAVLGLFGVIVALSQSCAPKTYAERQAAERPPCRDVALGEITAMCVAKIKATPNVTEKNRLRAKCLEDVMQWEQCQ